MNYFEKSLLVHKQFKGKLEIKSKLSLLTKEDLSIAYTPGVAQPCLEIAKNPLSVYDYTIKGNLVAIVSDGSAVLGLGNIGPLAAIPVMEGKAILFKEFAGIDAFPICLATQDSQEIIKTIKNIAPIFGGINLEDISSPRCFEIEDALQNIGIPVFHDDQHGTAIVVLAGLLNALKITNKKIDDIIVVVAGVGAAGVAISKLLISSGVRHMFLCDTKGIIYEGRGDLNPVKLQLSKLTNHDAKKGLLKDALVGADVFIGVSSKGTLTKEMVSTMNKDSIIFAMANPEPEIMPDDALAAGAKIVATGRSDFPNQINNVLAFPGIFKGALQCRIPKITNKMKRAAALAISSLVINPSVDKIIPSPLEKGVADVVAKAVSLAWTSEGGTCLKN
jgi:malate dehydrogenase (oxaloacetate-decarboxylating)